MPKLIIIEGNREARSFDLGNKTIFLGRSVKNDIQIRDTAVSRKQLKIYPIGKRYFVEDLKSTNGTYINEQLISPGEGYEIGEGDIISIGDTVIQLESLANENALEGKIVDNGFFELDEQEMDLAAQERRTRSQKELELIYKVSELIKLDITLSEFIDKLIDYLLEALPRIDQVVFVLFDSHSNQKGKTQNVIAKSRQGETLKKASYKEKVVERVVKERKAVRMSNTALESPLDYKESTTIRLGSIMCVPLISNLETRGVIYVDSFQGAYAFRKDDLLMLNSLSGSVAAAVEKATLSTLLKYGSDSKLKRRQVP
jgi:pSer/pThr/pTyr-binding forkhead associated (FHA) protein